MANWTTGPGSATAGWSAPRLVTLSAAGSALNGLVQGLTENQSVKYDKSGVPSFSVKFGYGPS